MKRKIGILFVLLALLICGVICFVINDKRVVFNGDRVKKPDCYTLDFSVMNQEDTHTFTLKEGDCLSVDFAIDCGKVDLAIGMVGEENIYNGKDIDSGVFELTIPKDGDYQVTVSAKHASGFIMIYAHEKD